MGVAVLSAFCSLHMANVVSQVPTPDHNKPNHNFDLCVEFSDPFRVFWHERWYTITQILFFLTATCMNVAAMVDTAEVVDLFLGIYGKTYALSAGGDNFNATANGYIQSWHHDSCTRSEVKVGDCDPFSNTELYGDYLLSLGYVLTAAVFVPISLMDLKENAAWQLLGFGILLASSIYFCTQFMTFHISLAHASWWGSRHSDMLGVILFNFSLPLAIPAWLHEKKRNVGAGTVIVHSTVLSTALYIAVGVLGGLSLAHVNVNMLTPMVSGGYGSGLQITGSIFAFFIIGLDIPLFSVLTRYNLTHAGLCSERMANLLVVWIPWLTSWIWYQGDSIKYILDWGGVLFTSVVVFLLPLYLALKVLRETDFDGSVNVYGCQLSRRTQVRLLMILLFLSMWAVAAALGGQIVSTGADDAYMRSTDYVNVTFLQAETAPAGKKHHRKHRRHRHRHRYRMMHKGHFNSDQDGVIVLANHTEIDVNAALVPTAP